jgi:hypothetical protein
MAKPNKAAPRVAIPTARRKATSSRAKKISVTVDPAVLSAVQKEAERKGRTLSAEVTDALARDLRRRQLQALIEDYEAEHGVITDDELAVLSSQ